MSQGPLICYRCGDDFTECGEDFAWRCNECEETFCDNCMQHEGTADEEEDHGDSWICGDCSKPD
jgi:hypothetical protein